MASVCGAQRLTLQRNFAFFGARPVLAVAPRPQRVAVPFVVTAAVIGPGKKWEHYKLTPNGLPVRHRMPVRTGDTVKIISGGDKGKVGKVLRVMTKTGEVVVEGVNIKTKHVKPAAQGEQGQIVKKEFPVHHSNVQLWSESSQTSSRVGFKVDDNGKKVRFMVKTGETVPDVPYARRATASKEEGK